MTEAEIVDNNIQKRKQENENDSDNKKVKLNSEEKNQNVNNKTEKNKNKDNGECSREREERPFENLEIADYEPLFHTKRELCKTCNKTFKNFCYNCLTVFDSVKQYIPNVKLPLPLDM